MRGYSEDFLENLHIREQSFSEWKRDEQTALQKTYCDVLSKLLDLLQQNGQEKHIVEIAERLLSVEPTDEAAHRALVLLHYTHGKQALALRQFEICKHRLWTEFGVSPSPETLQLYELIKGDNGEPTDPPVDRPPTPQPLYKPALAASPFTVHASDEKSTDYGVLLAEEIISAAAHFKWFRVIPRDELFREPLLSLSPTELSRHTGAKYVLTGRLRKTNQNHYSLRVELNDCENTDTVWSESFDIAKDEFPIPEKTIAKITCRLDVQIRTNEINQARQHSLEDLSGYECTLLALSNMYNLNRLAFNDAE